MTRHRILFALVMLAALAATPAFSQNAPEKKSPGAMAATDRADIQNRASCEREAKALKLGYFKRKSFIKNCMRR